jgi:hypothetical protein
MSEALAASQVDQISTPRRMLVPANVTKIKLSPLPLGMAPRGLSRDQAAAYLGIGSSLFDRLVADGTLPKPKHLAGRRVWDIRGLDRAFDALPDAGEANPWDEP